MIVKYDDKLYILPNSEDKPIKIVFEGRTIEDAMMEYFEDVTGYKADYVDRINDDSFSVCHKITKDELEELFGTTKLGVLNIE